MQAVHTPAAQSCAEATSSHLGYAQWLHAQLVIVTHVTVPRHKTALTMLSPHDHLNQR